MEAKPRKSDFDSSRKKNRRPAIPPSIAALLDLIAAPAVPGPRDSPIVTISDLKDFAAFLGRRFKVDGDDLLQDTFVKIIQMQAAGAMIDSGRGYAAGMLAKKQALWHRDRKRDQEGKTQLISSQGAHGKVRDSQGPAQILIDKEESARLKVALELALKRLRGEAKEIEAAKFAELFANDAIASELAAKHGVSDRVARSRVNSAHALLAELVVYYLAIRCLPQARIAEMMESHAQNATSDFTDHEDGHGVAFPGPRTQDPGPRTQDPGPRTQDPGPRTSTDIAGQQLRSRNRATRIGRKDSGQDRGKSSKIRNPRKIRRSLKDCNITLATRDWSSASTNAVVQ